MQPPNGLTYPQNVELLFKGILVTLEAEGSTAAVDVLYTTAAGHPLDTIQTLARTCLERLALSQNEYAANAVYRLSVEINSLGTRQFIETHSIPAPRPPLAALYRFLTGPTYPIDSESLALLTQAYYEESSEALRRRILAQAPQKGLANWSRLLAVDESLPLNKAASKHVVDELINSYPSFSEVERQAVLDRLTVRAAQPETAGGPAAQAIIARIFLMHQEGRARKVAVQKGYYPEEPVERALFFFLAELWSEYQSLDFDHSLLLTAYETGSRVLRQRILEHSRRTGHLEWLREMHLAGEVRWPSDLTDADWELAQRRLIESDRKAELWRLSQAAPPLWCAQMINSLSRTGWQPDAPDERAAYNHLSSLARSALAAPLEIQPTHKRSVPGGAEAGLNCLALSEQGTSPAGAVLAGGSQNQQIYCWNVPQGRLRQPPLSGPSAVTRALAFNPQGDYLASAAGDHRIRIFRLKDGAIIKTLEGHRALVRSLVVHPDGRLLASAGFDGSIRLWRFPFGPELKTIQPGPDEIFSLAIDRQGRYLFSAGSDRQISTWSLPEGNLVRQLNGHTDTITNLAASFENDLVASAGRDGRINIWNYASGHRMRTIEHSEGLISTLCMHPKGQVLIGASSSKEGSATGDIFFWNITTGQTLERLTGHHHPVTGLAVSLDGEWLYSSDTSGALLIWNLSTFLTVRLASKISQPGSAATLQERSEANDLSSSEKKWLLFATELARWRQRFDIELSEIEFIPIGEFDIEL